MSKEAVPPGVHVLHVHSHQQVHVPASVSETIW